MGKPEINYLNLSCINNWGTASYGLIFDLITHSNKIDVFWLVWMNHGTNVKPFHWNKNHVLSIQINVFILI